ncbi:MAG: LysR family transcriptional regulator [Sphaerochaetaceae bacterium]
MNDRQLRYMLTVAETKNVSSAARKLNISQPSLSAMIASVEEQMGTRLFERNGNPMKLTFAGECYVEAARTILAIMKDLESKMFSIQNKMAGKLVICCTAATSSIVMTHLIPKFIKEYPDIQIDLIEEHKSMVKKLLLSGDADIICSSADLNDILFDKQVLTREEMAIMAPLSFKPLQREHRADRLFDVIDLSELNEKPFAIMKHGHQMRRMQDAILENGHVHPNIILETDNWETIIGMVANDMAFSILPLVLDKLEEVRPFSQIFCTNERFNRELSVYWRKMAMQKEAVKAFVTFALCQYANRNMPMQSKELAPVAPAIRI